MSDQKQSESARRIIHLPANEVELFNAEREQELSLAEQMEQISFDTLSKYNKSIIDGLIEVLRTRPTPRSLNRLDQKFAANSTSIIAQSTRLALTHLRKHPELWDNAIEPDSVKE